MYTSSQKLWYMGLPDTLTNAIGCFSRYVRGGKYG